MGVTQIASLKQITLAKKDLIKDLFVFLSVETGLKFLQSNVMTLTIKMGTDVRQIV